MMKCFLRSFLPLVFAAGVLSAAPPVERLIVAPGEAIRLEAPSGLEVEACVDGGILRPNEGRIRAPEEGEHWLLTASRDELGRRSELKWIRIVVDRQAPELGLDLIPPAVNASGREWVAPAAVARIQASDDLSGVGKISAEAGRLRQDSIETFLELRLPDSGRVDLKARAVDRVGNRSLELMKMLEVDDRPPQIEWKIEGPWTGRQDAPVIAEATQIHCIAEDGESGLKDLRADEDGSEIENPVFAGAWSEGPHALRCRAEDQLGNRASGEMNIRVDLSPPEMRISLRSRSVLSDRGITFVRPPVSVFFEADDAPAGLERREISLDGGRSWEKVDASVEIPEGVHPLFRAVDRLGNSAEQEAFWTEDGEGPRIRFRFLSGSFPGRSKEMRVRRGARLKLVISDEGCGLEGARYRFDDRSWRPIPEEIVFGYPDTRFLEIEAWDALGNRSHDLIPVRVLESEGGR